MRISKVALLSASMVLASASLQAQTTCSETVANKAALATNCKVTSTVTADVPYLAVIAASTTTNALPAATTANMGGPTDLVAGPTLNVKTNFAWSLSASSTGFAANGSYTKDLADLDIAANENPVAGDWKPMSSAVALASTVNPTATQDVKTSFRVRYSWANDVPGSYSATVTYTLTAP